MPHRTLSSLRRGVSYAGLVAGLVLAVSSRGAAGGVILEIPDSTIQLGELSPALEVILRVTSGTPTLASYNVALVVLNEPGGFDLNFPEAVETQDHPAVFPGSDPQDNFPVPNDDTLFAADDLDSGSAPIVDGAGLIRVPLEILPGLVAGSTFVVGFDPGMTALFTSGENDEVQIVPIDEFRVGTMTVVPEPGSLLLAALALIGLAVSWRRLGRSCGCRRQGSLTATTETRH